MSRALVATVAAIALTLLLLVLGASDPPAATTGALPASPPDAGPRHRPTAPDAAQAAPTSHPIERRPPESTPAPSPALPPGTGIVVHDGGAPVPGARVELTLAVPRDVPPSSLEEAFDERKMVQTSDSAGRFEIPESFRQSNWTRATAERRGFSTGSARLGRDLTLRIMLGRSTTLRGRVLVAETGAPLGFTEIEVRGSRNTSPGRRIEARADGGYVLDRCYVGRALQLTVRLPDSVPHTVSFTPETPGEHRLDLLVPAGESFLGRAVDAQSGRGIGGARILVDGSRTGATLADGTFRVRRRPDPPFWLEIDADGYVPAQERIDAPRLEGSAVVVPLVVATVLEGRVTDTAGAPLAGVKMSLHDPYGAGGKGESGPDGRYLVEVGAPARYEVRVHTQEGSTPYRLAPETFDRRGERRRRDVVLPAETGRIVGLTLRDSAATRSWVTWSNGALSAARMTDDEGRFAFEGVAAGTVQIEVRMFEPETLAQRTVELLSGGTARIEIDVQRGPSAIAGVVLDAAGAPAAGVEVVLTGRASGATLRATTDPDGRFSVAAPAADESFDVRVTVGGRTLTRFGVVAGATALVLRPSG